VAARLAKRSPRANRLNGQEIPEDEEKRETNRCWCHNIIYNTHTHIFIYTRYVIMKGEISANERVRARRYHYIIYTKQKRRTCVAHGR